MTGREKGFLLLTSRLGDPDRKVLTLAQLRELTLRARQMGKPVYDRELTLSDLLELGCSAALSRRVLDLLGEEERLSAYLQRGESLGCIPLTRLSSTYPMPLWEAMGPDAPGSLWAKGDVTLLEGPMISLVGSRDLNEDNRRFAYEVGRQAALQGYTLISGNARGADSIAQNACLTHGGRVVSIVADMLMSHRPSRQVLYLSEEGFDAQFSSRRALDRNRLIHSMGQKVFVAQCGWGKGGTWSGTTDNLRRNRRPVFCFDDGSSAAKELQQLGAVLIRQEALADIAALEQPEIRFL